MNDEYANGLAGAVLEQIADAVIYADTGGIIRSWNRAASALFGYRAAEAVGETLDIIIPEHLRKSHWRGFNAAVSAGALSLKGRPTLTRASHKSGRKLYVEMTFALVSREATGVCGAVAVARDVTERVAKEQAATRGS